MGGTRTQLVETVRTPFRNVRYRQEGFALLCKVHFSVLANACLLPWYSLQSNQLNRGRLLCSPSPLFAEPKAQRLGERQVGPQTDFLARAAGCSGSESPKVRFGSSRSLR